MKHSVVVLCAVALLGIGIGASRISQLNAANKGDEQALRDNEIQWNKDYASKDLDKVVSHYADDAVLMVGGAPPSQGKTAIRATLKDMLSDSALSLKFEARRVVVAKAGDMGFTEGSYTLTVTNPATKAPVHDKGSYVTVYRKQADGSWKAVSDIATSEVPPAATTATQ